MVPTITKFPFAEALPLHAEALLLHLKALLLPFRDKIGIFYFFLRSVGAQAFLLPANGETERGVKTIDKLGVFFTFTKNVWFFVSQPP